MGRPRAVGGNEVRRRNVAKLKELGYTYKEIGSMYGVTDVAVYYWLCGDRRSNSRRKDDTYFRQKPRDNQCEVCHKSSILRKSVLQHHHWDHENPSVGIWVCGRCHSVVNLLDTEPELAKRYLDLKRAITRNYARQVEEKRFSHG